MSDLQVAVDGRELTADWTDDNPGIHAALADALPLDGDATRWGDELYVSTPVDAVPEETQEVVEEGTVAYWPSGNALCIFWGPTPASEGEEPRAASGVAVVARIDDTDPLEDLDGGATVRVERA